MAHIQSKRDRQFFDSQMTGHEVSEGIKKIGDTFVNTFNTGLDATQRANESTLANYQIDLSTKYLAKNNEINTKYQQDPTNPEREIELRNAFDSLAEQYQINPLCQKKWSDIKNNVYNRYKEYNAQWVEKTQYSNIQTNLKNGYDNLLNQISMLGMNGSGVDEIRLMYANGIEALRNGAVAGLGEVYVNDFLKDSNHDIMATYISSLALNNPLEAQKLLQDEGVLNDLGKAETIEKLNDYVSTSIKKQAQKTAINELGNTLRNMNSDEADNIINGKADLRQVMSFIENNKKLPEGSKEMILSIYGIGSKSEYYYDKDKHKIVRKPESSGGGSNGSGGKLAKMTSLDKRYISETLEQDLHKLLSFEDYSVNDVNEIKKNKNGQIASDRMQYFMNNVAQMQERIDSAYYSGAITQTDRKRMMNQYIAPVSDYIEQNLEQLDEKSFFGFAGKKLGYDLIKQQFNTDDLKGDELKSMQRQKLFAQNYYLDELNKSVKQLGMKNIYDIESLSPSQQREIYKTASENALKRANRWTDEPEIFFAKEYPDIYSQPSLYFKANEAKEINRIVAQAVYKRQFENPDGTSKLDLKEYATLKCKEEIQKKFKENQIKAGQTMGSIKTGDYTLSAPIPQTRTQLEKELKDMGYTIKDLYDFAKQKGYVGNEGLTRAILDIRHINSLKNKRK